jgi:hypothetical protein
MRTFLLGTTIAAALAAFTTGCVVTAEPATYGTVVYSDPPPDQRVYIYDPGYPPGCYYYGDEVYYEGRAYPRDVFVERVVNVNIRENRYISVDENRRLGNTYVQRDAGRYQTAHPSYRSPGGSGGNQPDLHRGGGRPAGGHPQGHEGRE